MPGIAFLETPVGQWGDGFGLVVQAVFVVGDEQFGGGQAGQFFDEGATAVYLCCGKLPGGNVGVGQAVMIAVADDGDEIIVAPRIQHPRLDDRPGRKNAHHFARHQPSDRLRADLLGQSHFVPFGDEPGDIPLGGVVRDAGHRRALIFALRPAGQD